jgi:hypothetical protein
MKKIEVQMLLYTLAKQFMKVQRNVLNAFGIILFTKWWGSFMVKTLVWSQGDQGLNVLPTYIM